MTGEDVLRLAAELGPELVILSLELRRPYVPEVIGKLRHARPDTCIVLAYRELAVSEIERLLLIGVDELLSQPVDLSALLRIVWQRFKINSRAHERHAVGIEVRRADGLSLGRTRNLSEGGMLLEHSQSLTAGQSLLFDLLLPENESVRIRGSVLGVVTTEGPVATPLARVQFEALRGNERQRLATFLERLAKTPAISAGPRRSPP
jgi:DNA-binding response OmpR family regulator